MSYHRIAYRTRYFNAIAYCKIDIHFSFVVNTNNKKMKHLLANAAHPVFLATEAKRPYPPTPDTSQTSPNTSHTTSSPINSHKLVSGKPSCAFLHAVRAFGLHMSENWFTIEDVTPEEHHLLWSSIPLPLAKLHDNCAWTPNKSICCLGFGVGKSSSYWASRRLTPGNLKNLIMKSENRILKSSR